jgi:hypothetical protein
LKVCTKGSLIGVRDQNICSTCDLAINCIRGSATCEQVDNIKVIKIGLPGSEDEPSSKTLDPVSLQYFINSQMRDSIYFNIISNILLILSLQQAYLNNLLSDNIYKDSL